jgi:hypothetical protein
VEESSINDYTRHHPNNKMVICFAYPEDLEQMYAFYCARYENISYEQFMKLGYKEFMMKLNSLPETEPFYKVVKSRSINLSKIKDKEERRYWRELSQINAIPSIYKSNKELNSELRQNLKNNKIGG